MARLSDTNQAYNALVGVINSRRDLIEELVEEHNAAVSAADALYPIRRHGAASSGHLRLTDGKV